MRQINFAKKVLDQLFAELSFHERVRRHLSEVTRTSLAFARAARPREPFNER
jgi:hypothetical protein